MSLAIAAFDGNYKTYDFEVGKEEWNEYELKDGTKVKGKQVLLKIVRRATTPPGMYELLGQSVFVATTDANRRRPPTPPLTADELQQINLPGPNDLKTPMEVVTSSEKWNQYRIVSTDELVKMKMILIDIYRITDRYDDLGEPMFSYVTGNIVAPLPPHGQIQR